MSFTLQLRKWYAMELTFPSGEKHFSPIWILATAPRKSGKSELDLNFWHANYSPGVQDKTYRLQVLRREAGYLLAITERGGGAYAAVVLSAITYDWMRLHFPDLSQSLRDPDNLAGWLHRHVGRPGSNNR